MSDRQKSTPPPPDFDPDNPLRETYADELVPEHRAILERLAGFVLELTREASVMEHYRTVGTIPANLRSATVDLRHVQGYLSHLGTMPETCERNPGEAILCQLAGLAAPEVGTVASRIERTIQAGEAKRLPVLEPFPDDFVLVVMFAQPEQHARWERVAGEQPVRVWLAGLADRAVGSNLAG
jgi:hypothetical protein